MPTLVLLPTEVQNEIAGHLNFPNLIRLRKTCRSMRDMPSQKTRRAALRRMEDEFIEGFTKAHMARLSDLESDPDSETYETFHETWTKYKVNAGYRGHRGHRA